MLHGTYEIVEATLASAAEGGVSLLIGDHVSGRETTCLTQSEHPHLSHKYLCPCLLGRTELPLVKISFSSFFSRIVEEGESSPLDCRYRVQTGFFYSNLDLESILRSVE